jgi:gliding motility-associated-like protein
MKKTRRFFFLAISLFYFVSNTSAQFSAFATSNANSLVNQIVGSGVQVTNITLNCNSLASGIFTANGTNLGLSSGIILSTAEIAEAQGPNNSPGGTLLGTEGCFNSSESFFDQDLIAIEPLAKYDGCALEFDLKPACDLLKVNFVFASEEYPEYVSQGYNDAFGFLIWGPNPAGGNYSGRNLAVIPGTSTTVSIDNINPSSNTNYYVNNENGLDLEYDGFTKPITSSIAVTTCQTYHLKFVIADAGDCRYSSAVLIAQGGLTCDETQSPQTTVTTSAVTCGNNGSASISVQNYTGNITYYWQPLAQTTSSLNNIAPGTYTCTLGFMVPCPFTQTLSVTIADNNSLHLTNTAQNSYCNTPSGIATLTVDGGTLPYGNPIWNTSPQQNTFTVDSLLPGIYSVTLSDAAGCTLTSSVTVGNTTPSINYAETILQSTCGHSNGIIKIDSIIGGVPPYTYYWNTNPIIFNQDLTNSSAGNYSLTITDASNCVINRTLSIKDSDSLLIDLDFTNETCNQLNGSIAVNVLNGNPPYQWNWSNGTTNQSFIHQLDEGFYTFNVQDATGCSSGGQITLTNQNYYFTGNTYTLPPEPKIGEPFELGINLTAGWELTQLSINNAILSSADSAIQLLYNDIGYFESMFYIQNQFGCLDTIIHRFEVNDFSTLYIPNTIVASKSSINNIWKAYGTLIKSIEILVFNRWGEKVFESIELEKGWDGTFAGKICPEDTYIYLIKAEDMDGNQKQYSGHLYLIR